MTALDLLGMICAVLLFELGLGVLILLWRQRRNASAVPTGDLIEVPVATGAWSGWRDFRVVRRQFEDPGCTQCSFHLQPVDGVTLLPFQPGQYLTLAVPTGTSNFPCLTRCYSLSDQPESAGYRITVKRALPPPDRPELPAGVASGHLHDHVGEGDVLKVKAPAGRFFIDPDAGVAAVFIAGGIGITPMISMLRWCATEQPERPVHLFYGVRSGAEQAFKPLLHDLARVHRRFRLHVVYSNPGPGDVLGQDYQHAGRIDLGLLRSSLPHGRHQFYVCGPPRMMQGLLAVLRDWGVREDDIHFEAFGPAAVRPPVPVTNEPTSESGGSIDVRFSRSGRTLVWDGQDANLLDFAERHGVVIESGCRSGSCGSCETGLQSGVVVYANPPDHQIAKGHCLLCVGRPQSDLELAA